MKDSLDILRTDYRDNDSISHHGVKGMKWGVRKKEDTSTTRTVSNDHGFTGRKKKVTEGDGTGAHKRGEGQHYENAFEAEGVGPYYSYHNSVNVYGSAEAPISTQLGQELKTAMFKEIMESEEYKNVLKLIKEFDKLADTRKNYQNQGSTAATMVFEEKASKLIREINSNLSSIDSKFADKTKLVKQTVNKTYSPSKDILDFLSPSSSSLNIDKKTGRVSKGWKSSPTVSNGKTGWRL